MIRNGVVGALVLVAANASAELRDAPEKALVLEYCVACHGVERIENEGGTIAGWTDRIHRMGRWGAKLPEARIDPLAAYLARELPVRPRPARSTPEAHRLVAVSRVAIHPIQTSIRGVGTLDRSGRIVVTTITTGGSSVEVGQRVRVFHPNARSSIRQGRVTRVAPRMSESSVEVALISAEAAQDGPLLLEVIVERGRFLSIPNDALLEDDGQTTVYIQGAEGAYVPRPVEVGIRGDRFSQILSGLGEGDEVVTLGTFFVDADFNLKSSCCQR